STGLDARTATIKAMDEVTGPIIAVALVLGAVFVPCAFIGGITGQFFRQFAVTIAVSTFISAINAITMTPSRAVLIFKTEPGAGHGEPGAAAGGHKHKREALPWWSFAAIGGLLAVKFGPRLLAWCSGQPAPAGGGDAAAAVTSDATKWAARAVTAQYFAAGALVGGVFGWDAIRPVNALLGWCFRGFKRYFDTITPGYGWVIGKALWLAAGMLLAYGGLLVLTYIVFQKAPTGFIPQQDMGRLIVNVQLPDSASLQRTQEVAALVEKIARGDKNDPENFPG